MSQTTISHQDYEISHFEENGFAFCSSILTVNEAAKVLQQVQEEFASQPPCTSSNNEEITSTGNHTPSQNNCCLEAQGNDRFKVHLFLSEVNRIVHHPKLLQCVRQALQTETVALWSSDLNIKQPNSKQYFSEHQDATYTGLQPASRCVTVWVALSDPVGISEGCLSFLQGSHKAGQLPHVEEGTSSNNDSTGDTSINLLSRGQRVLYHTNKDTKDEWVSIPLRAGEATLHHFYTIHKSGHNHHPTQHRVGLALRYIAYDVQQTGPVRECITLMDHPTTSDDDNSLDYYEQRRQLLLQHFDLEPRLPAHPSAVDVENGRRAHDEAMRREASNYFMDSTNAKGYDEKESK